MSSENPSLEEEREGMLQRIRELDQMREQMPQLQQLREEQQILQRQQAYLASLGFFRRSEKRRMEAQIREKRQQVLELEIEVENLQHSIEDEIRALNLARQAIETEMERRAGEVRMNTE